MTHYHRFLPCGASFLAEEMPQMETIALAISVDVGARWESEQQHGISHLLEHMAFKGTPTHSALEIAEIFDAIGGHFNAFTSHEHTVYYAKVLAEHWQTASEILCDIVQHSLFDETELAREKGVILQELAMHHDTPDDLVFDLFQQAAYGDQALGRSVLGTQESIQRHGRDDIISFVKQHYQAPRICVSAAGQMNAQHIADFISEKLDFSANETSEFAQQARYIGGEKILKKSLEQLQLVIGLPSLPTSDPRYYALGILCNLLGGGMSSRLFQEVREKRGLVYSIQSFNASYAETGLFGIYAASDPQHAGELMEVIAGELGRAARDITPEELSRTQQQQIASLRMARENTATLAEWMGRHQLQFGQYRNAAMLAQQIESVTLAQLQTLAEELFTAPTLCLAAMGDTQHLMPTDAFAQRLAA